MSILHRVLGLEAISEYLKLVQDAQAANIIDLAVYESTKDGSKKAGDSTLVTDLWPADKAR